MDARRFRAEDRSLGAAWAGGHLMTSVVVLKPTRAWNLRRGLQPLAHQPGPAVTAMPAQSETKGCPRQPGERINLALLARARPGAPQDGTMGTR